jgi:hypothetical protein
LLLQALFAMCVLMLSMTTHAYADPYDHWVLNQFQFVCYVALFLLASANVH